MAERIQLAYERVEPVERIGLASSDQYVTLIGRANLKIQIRTSRNGSITVRDTPVWILKEKMEEVLLGDDVLIRLGIDVHEQ